MYGTRPVRARDGGRDTLLDNDAVVQDYRAHLVRESGADAAEHYWTLFEELRRELGCADYLGAPQRHSRDHLHDPRLLLVSSYLLDYPFAERLYPGALEVLARCGRLGRTVVFSDGDVAFQPRKIERSGIRRAVEGRVLVESQVIDLVKQAQERRRRQRAAGGHTGRADLPLTEQGERQASALGASLGALRIDRILSSPLQRARRATESASTRYRRGARGRAHGMELRRRRLLLATASVSILGCDHDFTEPVIHAWNGRVTAAASAR